MRRSLRSLGVAVGLPFIVAFVSSCADQLTRPVAMRAVAPTASIVYPDVRISEIHYDNAGTDAGEAIEISGPAGTSLDGWSLVLFNGSGGAAYNTRALSGTIPASCGDRGVVVASYPSNGIQNGSPDGVALVGPDGVVEFLSYEGPMTATTLPALGMISRDIGASEPDNAPVGHSLQRSESDAWYWQSPAANSFGACNTFSAPAITSVTVTPSPTSVVEGATRTLTAKAFAGTTPLNGAPMTWSSDDATVASVDVNGVVSGLTLGETRIRATAANGIAGSAVITVDAADPTPPAGPVGIVEIHYDNAGADVGEAIEIMGPAGYRLSGWTLVLYNGSNNSTYGTIALSGAFPSMANGQGVLSFAAPGLQNGNPDGIALVDGFGTVVEFLSYGGIMTAANGPASGIASTDIGVNESGTTAVGRSLQRDADGWYGPAASSFGAINVAPAPSVSIFGRTTDDGPLPVGFEDQIFAEVRDKFNAVLPTTFTWSSETPAIAAVDQDGVVRSLAPGSAIIRATSANGFTGTFTLPTYVATASTTAQYAGNTEFGVPTDSDPGDDFIITRDQYTSSFSRTRGIPNWVSFNLEATHTGPQNRCECFTYDPALPADFTRYTTADYTGAGAFHGYGIDRGHLVRSFDRTAGSLDNATTFYFSNIIPQASDNNQGPWGDLEMYLGAIAQAGDKELYVIAGASGSKGTVKNEGVITIPTHTWKVAVIMPRDHGLAQVDSHDDVQVIAVIMPNDAGIDGVDWNTYRTSINAVETLSGYDLLALLPDGVEALVETGLSATQASVDALVAAGRIDAGVASSLSAKIAAAGASIERGNTVAARNQLRALLNEIEAMERSRRLSAADAAALRTAIAGVMNTL